MPESVVLRLASQVWPGDQPHVDEFGVSWMFTNLLGFWDDTASTGDVTQNAYSDGGWADEAFEESRTVIAEGHFWADSVPQIRDAIDRLKAAIPRGFTPFVVDEAGLVRHVTVRKEGKPSIVWSGGLYVTFSLQMIAPIVHILSGDGTGPTFTGGPVGLPKNTGGQRYGSGPNAARYPLRTVATRIAGSVTVPSAGNATPPVLVRISGPLPGFTITGDLDGVIQSQAYIEAIDVGQFVDINLDGPRSFVKINGTTSRRNRLLGDWIVPAPGMTFSFSSSVENDLASMTVFSYDAWR